VTEVAAPKGRLFGRNVLEGIFRAAPDEDLFLGELLVGVDETTGRRYLFRVVDVTYGTEHREPGWAERVAGTLLADDVIASPDAHPLYDRGRRTYRVAQCRCLGYVSPDGRSFRKPKSLPTQFSRVVAPEPADFAFLRSRMGDLPIGRLRSGETEVDVEVGIPGTSLASHVGIFATTGMGKSNLMQVLTGAVMRRQGRYGLLLVDPHGEYRAALSRHPWAPEALRTYAARSLPGTTSLRVSLAELSIDDLRTAYDWSRSQGRHCSSWSASTGRTGCRGCWSSPSWTTSPASGTSTSTAVSRSTPSRSCTAGPDGSSSCRAWRPIPPSRSVPPCCGTYATAGWCWWT